MILNAFAETGVFTTLVQKGLKDIIIQYPPWIDLRYQNLVTQINKHQPSHRLETFLRYR
jgi:hypothetical protein